MSENSGVWIRIACDPCDGTGVEHGGHGEYTFEHTCRSCEGTGCIEGLASDYDDAQWLKEEAAQ